MKRTKPLHLPMSIIGENSPVFHFSYEGVLPPYRENRKERIQVRDRYLMKTLETYNWSEINNQFERAAIYVAYYFASNRKRDLDNRNRKYLLDALRRTLLIKDDCWQHVSWMEEGFRDIREHTEVFVMDRGVFSDFLNRWDTYGLKLLIGGMNSGK